MAEEAGLSGAQSYLGEGLEYNFAWLQDSVQACRGTQTSGRYRWESNHIHGSTPSQGSCLLYDWEATELSALY